MPAVHEHAVTVGPEDIDGLGHASNVVYLDWLQAAAIAHSAAQGWSTADYHTMGAGWVVRSHHIEYLQPALPGDELLIRTWVATMQKVRSLRRYEVRRPRDDALLAEASTDWAFIDFASRAPRRVPPEISNAFEVVD